MNVFAQATSDEGRERFHTLDKRRWAREVGQGDWEKMLCMCPSCRATRAKAEKSADE